MKKKKVFLMSGPPASGKSTWIREHRTVNSEWISRDKVRFSIVGEDEAYFSHEDEVFDTFIAYINQTLENPDIEEIFIDATHINKKSRYKTTSRIDMKNVEELNCVWFNVRNEVCQLRNSMREGRERVPSTAIDNMFKAYKYPDFDEKFDHLYIVNENGDTREVFL